MNIVTEKQKLIQKIIRMQKDFLRRQRDSGLDARAYYAPDGGDNHAQEHDKLAMRVVELAHAERGSKR